MAAFYAVYPPSGSSVLPTGAATAANQVLEIADLDALNAKGMASFLTKKYDEMVITYVGATTDIDTVVTKLATVTQQTLTLSYDGSNRLSGVVVS